MNYGSRWKLWDRRGFRDEICQDPQSDQDRAPDGPRHDWHAPCRIDTIKFMQLGSSEFILQCAMGLVFLALLTYTPGSAGHPARSFSSAHGGYHPSPNP